LSVEITKAGGIDFFGPDAPQAAEVFRDASFLPAGPAVEVPGDERSLGLPGSEVFG